MMIEWLSVLLLAVALSMDAFAVSLCKGLALGKPRLRDAVTVGLWFGGFQALMPTLGYLLGAAFAGFIEAVDHWIAFVLLAAIGVNMIREALGKAELPGASLRFTAMLPLAIATSIDALASGISLSLSGMTLPLIPVVLLIGLTTFTLSAVGVSAGSALGLRFRSKAELCGGVILILLGIRILVEHLFF